MMISGCRRSYGTSAISKSRKYYLNGKHDALPSSSSSSSLFHSNRIVTTYKHPYQQNQQVRWKHQSKEGNEPKTSNGNNNNNSSSSVQDRIQSMVQDGTNQLLKQGSTITKELYGKSKSIVTNTTNDVAKQIQESTSILQKSTKNVLERTTTQVSKQANEATKNVSNHVYQSTSNIYERSKSTTRNILTAMSSRISNQFSNLSVSVRNRIYQSISSISKRVSTTAQSTWKNNIVIPIQTNFSNAFASIQGTGNTVLRYFWWWSLAAIFVYGIATTLPTALLRYALIGEGNHDNSNSNRNSNNSNNKDRIENGPERNAEDINVSSHQQQSLLPGWLTKVLLNITTGSNPSQGDDGEDKKK